MEVAKKVGYPVMLKASNGGGGRGMRIVYKEADMPKEFKEAIDEIDKTIVHLQKTKDALLSSVNNLRLANNKAMDLSIKRLTRNNPTMQEKFAAVRQTQEEDGEF